MPPALQLNIPLAVFMVGSNHFNFYARLFRIVDFMCEWCLHVEMCLEALRLICYTWSVSLQLVLQICCAVGQEVDWMMPSTTTPVIFLERTKNFLQHFNHCETCSFHEM